MPLCELIRLPYIDERPTLLREPLRSLFHVDFLKLALFHVLAWYLHLEARGLPAENALLQAGDVGESLAQKIAGDDGRAIAAAAVEDQLSLGVRLERSHHQSPGRSGNRTGNDAAVQFVGLAHIDGHRLFFRQQIGQLAGIDLRQMRQCVAHPRPVMNVGEISSHIIQPDAVKGGDQFGHSGFRREQHEILARFQNPACPGGEQLAVWDVDAARDVTLGKSKLVPGIDQHRTLRAQHFEPVEGEGPDDRWLHPGLFTATIPDLHIAEVARGHRLLGQQLQHESLLIGLAQGPVGQSSRPITKLVASSLWNVCR